MSGDKSGRATVQKFLNKEFAVYAITGIIIFNAGIVLHFAGLTTHYAYMIGIIVGVLWSEFGDRLADRVTARYRGGDT